MNTNLFCSTIFSTSSKHAQMFVGGVARPGIEKEGNIPTVYFINLVWIWAWMTSLRVEGPYKCGSV